MADTSNQSSFPLFIRNLKEKEVPREMSAPGSFITLVLAITSISVGSVYFHDCRAQYLIPYYLIISGVATILLLISSFLPCRNKEEPSILIFILVSVFQLIFGLFQLAFFIAGNVWIYSINAPNYTDPEDANYCHKGLYLYAFWITTLAYICLGLLFPIGCCRLLCFCCLLSSASSDVPG